MAASNTVLIGLFKNNFELKQWQSQLVDTAFYTAYGVGSLIYFLWSIFLGDPLNRIGYKKGLMLGLFISSLGAFGFVPAAQTGSFILMLSSLFLVAFGFALQQIVANPYVIALGDPAKGAHRVSLAGGINSFGTTIGPLVLAFAIYGNIAQKDPVFVTSGAESLEVAPSIARTTNLTEERSFHLAFAGQQKEGSLLLTDASDLVIGNLLYENAGKVNGGLMILDSSSARTNALVEHLKEKHEGGRTPVLVVSNQQQINEIKRMTASGNASIKVKFRGVDGVVLPSLLLGFAFILMIVLIRFSNLPSITNDEKMEADFGAFRFPQIWLGMIAIFVYVGVEVSIQSNLPEYFRQTFGRAEQTTVHFISLYWGSLMIGRWSGAISVFNLSDRMRKLMMTVVPLIAFGVVLVVNYIKGSPLDEMLTYLPFVLVLVLATYLIGDRPAKVMIGFGALAALLLLLGMLLDNALTPYFFISGGLFCSVMWPCIFSLSIAGLGKYTNQGSSLLIMMILGGAAFPVMQGLMADTMGIGFSYILPLIGFLYLSWFGWKVGRVLQKQGLDY